MKLLTLVVAAALAGCSSFSNERTSAASGSTPERHRLAGGVSVDLMKEFESLDANKDGFVNRSELASQPELAAIFEKADKNRDGKLDPAEYQVLKAEKGSKGGE
jgi:hypothetical protein